MAARTVGPHIKAAVVVRRWLALTTSMVVVALFAIVLAPVPQASAAGSVLVDETFTGTSVADPAFVPLGTACLTSAAQGSTPPAGESALSDCTNRDLTPPDDASGGYLQLTDNEGFQTGAVLYNSPLTAAGGLDIRFQQYQFGGSGADGIGFFLVDGSTDLTATGGTGGSMGYAQFIATPNGVPTSEPGVTAGYLGLGLDAYGNFANDGEGRGAGCPEESPFGNQPNPENQNKNSVTLRSAGNGLSGYCFVASQQLETPLSADTLQESEHNVEITVSADQFPIVTVFIDGMEVFSEQMPTAVPPTYKFGFTGSTGGSTDVHLIRNLTVSSAEPLGDINLVKQINNSTTQPASYTAGDTIPYQFVVTNPGAEPLTDVDVTDPLVPTITCPATMLAAAGNPGSSMVCTGSHTVTAAEAAAGTTLSNTATATAMRGEEEVQDSSMVDAPITPAPGIKISKTATLNDEVTNDGLAEVGETITYGFTVTNTGNTTLNNVTVNDPRAGTVTCGTTSIPAGGSTTCMAANPYAVTQADVDSGNVANSATASGTPPGMSRITSDPATTNTPTVTSAPQIVITKHARLNDTNGNNVADVGETINYTFVVTNRGNVTLTNVGVTDNRVGAVTCPATTLAPGATTRCTAANPYTVTQDDVDAGGGVGNTATASGTPPSGPPVTSNSSTNVPTPDQNPSLAITKSAQLNDANGNGLADVGETIDYSFTVFNNGNDTINDIAINDDLAGPVSCVATSLAPGASTTCTADNPYTVTQADVDAGDVQNHATASGTDEVGDPAISNTASTDTDTVTADPAIAITKHATLVDDNDNGVADLGEHINYTFAVVNNGNVTLTGIGVVDSRTGTVTCPTTTLAPGAATTCRSHPYIVTQADIDHGRVDNTATATGTPPSGADVTDTSSTSEPTPDPNPSLALVKSAHLNDTNGNHFADVGETIDYSFTVFNNGNQTITNIAINDALAGPVSCVATSLAPQGSTTCTANNPYTVTQADVNAGVVHNSATGTGTDPNGGDVTSNQATTNTNTVVAAPAVAITKTAQLNDTNGNDLADVGETIDYSFTVSNPGNVTMTGIVVNDQLAGLVTCAATTLDPGDSTTCTPDNPFIVGESNVLDSVVHNSATATATDPGGDDVESDPATTDTPTVAADPSLAIVKQAMLNDTNNNNLADVGETIDYTFTVVNNGNLTISDVGVTDDLAGPVTCTAPTLAPGDSTACTANNPFTVSQADIDSGGPIHNSATGTGIDPAGNDVTSDPSTTDTPVPAPQPHLSIQKHARLNDTNGNSLADAGETIDYSFTVTNRGNDTLQDIVVHDRVAGPVSCSATTLAPGASTTCTADNPFTVSESDLLNGVVHNSATATATDPQDDNIDSHPSTTDTPTVAGDPSLAIVKQAQLNDANNNNLADAGETIDYSFQVINNGNLTITGAGVNDSLAGPVTCPVASLAPGDATTCTANPYTVTQDNVDAGHVTNSATATGTDPSGRSTTSQPSSTVTPTVLHEPSIEIQKRADLVDANHNRTADVGERINYSFVVTNNGNVTVSGATVTDSLVGTVSCPNRPLQPGMLFTCTADHPYTVTQDDVNAGVVHNQATAQARDVDGNRVTSNPARTDTATTPHAPMINVNKTAHLQDRNRNGASVGEVIDYRFKVTNTGNVTMTGIVLRDQFLGTVRCPRTTLQPLKSMICSASRTVTQANVNGDVTIYNVATVTGTPPTGRAITSVPSDAIVRVEQPDVRLSLVKRAHLNDANGNHRADLGETIDYTFVVTNPGNNTISHVSVRDSKLGPVSCPVSLLRPGESVTCVGAAPYTVTTADLRAGMVRNVATAHGIAPVGDDRNVVSDPALSILTAPRLRLPTLPNTGIGSDLMLAGLAGIGVLLSGVIALVSSRRRLR